MAHTSTCPSAGSLDVFIDPQLPRPRLVVIGATPAAHTLVRLGATMGFTTCAMHPGATAADFPEADLVIGSLDLSAAPPNANVWCVVATMGHYDEDALDVLLHYDAAYIGLVASRRRMATVLGVLRDRGVGGLDRIRRAADSSVGGSQEEIALATLAEIVAERHARHRAEAVMLPPVAVDAVCGMSVETEDAMHTWRTGDTTYYFCSAGCLDAFKSAATQTPQTLASH